MPNHRSPGVFAVAGTVLLVAVVTAGCGRRGLPAAVAGGDEAVASPVAAATSVPTEPVPTGTTDAAEPGAESPPGVASPPGAASPPAAAATAPPNPGTQPTPAPLATPDLDSIERLLADLDAALGADATAATAEGSPK